MGAGASANSSSTVISPESLPDELFVEGAGSIKVNGRFVLRKCQDAFPTKNFANCEPSVWFAKDGDEGCWMGLLNTIKSRRQKELEPRKWIICTDQEILYIASITGAKITPPRQGRWELGGSGAAPAPTVNLQPLPSAFRLSGWKGHQDCLNGEYLPFDDGTKLINERPIFEHTPVMNVMIADEGTLYMYWSHGAWRVGDNKQLKPDKMECMAFIENNADNPTDMLGELVWKVTRNKDDISTDEHDFEDVEGVNLAAGTNARIYVGTIEGDDVTSLSVRPWLDDIRILQAQVFSNDTPSQRQHLLLGDKLLEDDGRVLAQHGVVAESTIHLLTFDQKDILDELFNESGSVGAIEVIGDPMPGNTLVAYWDAAISNTDGRIYFPPDTASQAVRFDPATETWELFGDIFQETRVLVDEKTRGVQLSSIDNCTYSPPMLGVLNRFLKIDPEHGTAREVGEDLRPLAGGAKAFAWTAILEGADGCLYAVPANATSVLRFDPRDTKATAFAQLEDPVAFNYHCAALGPSGRYIFAPPSNAARALCIDTQNQTVELIGDNFGTIESNDLVTVLKWVDCALAGDNCIYAIPTSAGRRRLLRIDPATRTTSLFGPRLHGAGSLSGASLCGWYGVCAGMDGCLYAVPHFAKGILRIDPFTKKVSHIADELPSNFPSKMTLNKSVIDRDGAIWMIPCNPPARMVRLAPRRPQTALLSTLLQPRHHALLHEGLRDQRCYGPALVVALWREANRIGADSALVSKLLETAATSLPTVVTESLKQDNGSTACMLMRTILAVLPPQEKDYYFNPTPNTWAWHKSEAQKRGMSLASVTSEEEHIVLHKITKGVETWLGGCRKSTSRQPADTFDSEDSSQFKGAEDWKWSDGTPWSFTIWNSVEPNNGSKNISGGEDRVAMANNNWFDRYSGIRIAGIYRKHRYSPPFEAIRSLVTDGYVLRQCFAASDQLRRYLIRMLYRVISMKQSALSIKPPADKAPRSRVKQPVNNAALASQAIGIHLKEAWPVVASALSAIGRAPLTLSSNDLYRDSFLSHIVASSAILEAAAPNSWKPVPKHADDWAWPPAPLVPLRAAAKIVQNLGPDSVRAVWPVLAGAIVTVLIRMEAAVRADVKHATDILITIFDKQRKSSLGTYHKQLRRARRDPTFPEFKSTAAYLMDQLSTLERNKYRRQTITSFPELYEKAYILSKRFNDFLAALAQKCSGAKALEAPLKGAGRALEKLVLRPGAAAEIKAGGLEALDTTHLVDVLRGSLECPDFTEIAFLLDLLEVLDVDLGDPKKAREQGWDLDKFQIRLINLKDRFTAPTSGGWADCMLNFSFVHGDNTHHVMEIQLQHSQMLVVRKEGKAHDRYNSFRSAFELLEAVGREPHDRFQEKADDLPPLQTLENKMVMQNTELKQQIKSMQQQTQSMQQKMQSMQQQMQSMQQQMQEMRSQKDNQIILM